MDSSAILLLNGAVKIVVDDQSGQRTLLALRVGGDLIGEMSVFDAEPRHATAIAATEVFYKRVAKAELLHFMERYPDTAVEIAKMVSRRLRWADRRRIEQSMSATVRIARVLVDLYETYGTRFGARWDLNVPLTREDLASIAGVGLSTTEKIIRTLQQDGLVSARYRGVSVLDMSRLRTVAEIQ